MSRGSVILIEIRRGTQPHQQPSLSNSDKYDRKMRQNRELQNPRVMLVTEAKG